MEPRRLLQKYFWAMIAALLAVGAYFQAAGVTALIGTAMAPQKATGPSPAPVSIPPHTPGVKSGTPILARNPFDSVTGPLTEQPATPGSAQTPRAGLDDPLNVPPCQGVQVHGTTQAKDPRWSLAIVQGPGEAHGKLRRIGDQVANKEIVYIGFNPERYSPAVWLSDDTGICQSVLFDKKSLQPGHGAHAVHQVKHRRPHRPRRRRGPPPLPSKIASKIQRLGPTEFNVDRSAVDAIMAQQAQLMRSVRVMPDQKGGKVVGIRVLNVRPNTLLGKLGFKNGDSIQSINGFQLSSPEKALQAYARLRTASNIAVKVTRRGKPVSIEFHLR